MVDGVIWDHEAVGSSPAIRTTRYLALAKQGGLTVIPKHRPTNLQDIRKRRDMAKRILLLQATEKPAERKTETA